MTENKENKPLNLEVQLDEITALGQYVNMMVVQHSPTEFVLDFIFVPPGQPRARVRSRIILAPEHARSLLKVLAENIGIFEKRFGEIKLPEHPGGLPTPHLVQ
jgi:hypothetical protein